MGSKTPTPRPAKSCDKMLEFLNYAGGKAVGEMAIGLIQSNCLADAAKLITQWADLQQSVERYSRMHGVHL